MDYNKNNYNKNNNKNNYQSNYDDIINLPHHVSNKHPQMSLYARSAQFAPFAALTGYEELIEKTTEITNKKYEKTEYEKNKCGRKSLTLRA